MLAPSRREPSLKISFRVVLRALIEEKLNRFRDYKHQPNSGKQVVLDSRPPVPTPAARDMEHLLRYPFGRCDGALQNDVHPSASGRVTNHRFRGSVLPQSSRQSPRMRSRPCRGLSRLHTSHFYFGPNTNTGCSRAVHTKVHGLECGSKSEVCFDEVGRADIHCSAEPHPTNPSTRNPGYTCRASLTQNVQC